MADTDIQALRADVVRLQAQVAALEAQLRKLTGRRGELDGSAVIQAIQSYERLNGPAWRK